MKTILTFALLLFGFASSAWSMDLGSCIDLGEKDSEGAVVIFGSQSRLSLMELNPGANSSLVVAIAHKFDYEAAPKVLSATVQAVRFALRSEGEGFELDLGEGRTMIISAKSSASPWYKVLGLAQGHMNSLLSSSDCHFEVEALRLLRARVTR